MISMNISKRALIRSEKLSHRVCKFCGYYDGQEIIKVEAAK